VSRLRDIARLLAVAAAFGGSAFLFSRATHFNFASPWFGMIAMLCFLGLAAVARLLFLPRMPRWLRTPRHWEVSGRIYRMLGVAAFGALLRRTPLRRLNAQVYLRRYPGDPAMLSAQLEAAEAAHFWAAALIVPYMAYACVQARWDVFFCFAVVQIAGNVYPILHLRWVRGRLARVREKLPKQARECCPHEQHPDRKRREVPQASVT